MKQKYQNEEVLAQQNLLDDLFGLAGKHVLASLPKQMASTREARRLLVTPCFQKLPFVDALNTDQLHCFGRLYCLSRPSTMENTMAMML